MRVLLDTNVVLDVLLEREPFLNNSQAVWDACDAGRLAGHISAVTLTTVFYVARRSTGVPRALECVRICLEAFTALATTRETLDSALRMTGADFEDSVQIATATAGLLEAIVRRDRDGYAGSPIPVFSPAELLAQLTGP